MAIQKDSAQQDNSNIKKLCGPRLFNHLDLKFADLTRKLAGKKANRELYLASAMVSYLTSNEKHICLDFESARCKENLSRFFDSFLE